MNALVLCCCLLGAEPDDMITGSVPAMVNPGTPEATPKAAEPEHKYTVVVWSAEWCQPCQEMHPDMVDLYFDGYPFQFADVDKHAELAKAWGIKSIPTLVLRDNGTTVSYLKGKASKTDVLKWMADFKVPKGPARDRPVQQAPAPRVYQTSYVAPERPQVYCTSGSSLGASSCGAGGCGMSSCAGGCGGQCANGCQSGACSGPMNYGGSGMCSAGGCSTGGCRSGGCSSGGCSTGGCGSGGGMMARGGGCGSGGCGSGGCSSCGSGGGMFRGGLFAGRR